MVWYGVGYGIIRNMFAEKVFKIRKRWFCNVLSFPTQWGHQSCPILSSSGWGKSQKIFHVEDLEEQNKGRE